MSDAIEFHLTPFNINLLQVSDDIAKLVRPVSSLDIFEGMTKNLHPEGLYSQEIFGVRGTAVRYKKFSWIDLKVPIFHPLIFKSIMSLRAFYSDVVTGRAYAKFDDATKDLVACDPSEGGTGYDFFFNIWNKIVFPTNESQQRQETLMFISNFRDRPYITRPYVLPAGYRDLEVDEHGVESSDDVNGFYYKLIALTRTISPQVFKTTPAAYNQQRMAMQNAVQDIYDYILNILDGKNGFIASKFAARQVANSTRNVITSMRAYSDTLGGPAGISINTAFFGVHQYVRALLPISTYRLMNGFLSSVFVAAGAPALLTDKKTRKSVRTNISPAIFDRWMSTEGLTKLIATYAEPSIRNTPIEIAGCYLGLVYRGPDMTFKLIHSIDELPQGRDPQHCTPITLTELFYVTMYATSEKYPFFTTRYPINTDRSIRPVKGALVPTVKTQTRSELDGDWRPYGDKDHLAARFPELGSETFNSMAPHSASLSMHDADFDGDMMSAMPVYSVESTQEVHDLFQDRSFYIGPDNKFRHDLSTATINYVLHNFTGPRPVPEGVEHLG